MFETGKDAAVAAVLSMLLEVSASPKAGNVDREHNFEDLRFEHFLASATSSFPVFLKATATNSTRSEGCGELILKAVKTSMRWHKAQNVHFGAFLLLIPLLKSWNSKSPKEAGKNASSILKESTYEDSLKLLRAFRLSSARVMDAENLNLRSNETEKLIRERDVNLYSWMKMAPKENIIAKELVEEYRISIKGSEKIKRFFEEFKDINYSIILCYYHILSENLDPLIISKFGKDTAESVSKRAGELIRNPSNDIYQNLRNFQSFDVELIKRGINPGSVADLTISSIYLALMDGLRF